MTEEYISSAIKKEEYISSCYQRNFNYYTPQRYKTCNTFLHISFKSHTYIVCMLTRKTFFRKRKKNSASATAYN